MRRLSSLFPGFILLAMVVLSCCGGLSSGTSPSNATAPAGESAVLSQNTNGSLAGSLSGTGYFNFTDGHNAGGGYGFSATSPAFYLATSVVHGPATVAIRPLFSVAYGYQDIYTTPKPCTFGDTDLYDLNEFSYSSGAKEGDFLQNLRFRVNNVHFKESGALISSGSTKNGYQNIFDDNPNQANLEQADNLYYGARYESYDTRDSLTRWATSWVTTKVKFNYAATEAGDCRINLFVKGNVYVNKWCWAGPFFVRGTFDGDDIRYVKVQFVNVKGGNNLDVMVEVQDYWEETSAPRSLINGDCQVSNFSQYLDDAGQLTVRIVSYGYIQNEGLWSLVRAVTQVDQVSVTQLEYWGGQTPAGVTIQSKDGLISPSETKRTVSYTDFVFSGKIPLTTKFEVVTPYSISLSPLTFDVIGAYADAYLDSYTPGGINTFPSTIASISLLGGIPLTMSGDRSVASGTIPSIDDFIGYNPSNGLLDLRLLVSSGIFNNLTCQFAANYSVGIPIAINYTSGAGNVSRYINSSLTAYSLHLTSGVLSGPLVGSLSVSFGSGGIPEGRVLSSTLLGVAPDGCPMYNTTWPEKYVLPIGVNPASLGLDSISVAITTDTFIPSIGWYHLPPMNNGNPWALFEEDQYMQFNISVTDESGCSLFLCWQNKSNALIGPGNLSIDTFHLSTWEKDFDVPVNDFTIGAYYDFWMVVIDDAGNYAATPAVEVHFIGETAVPVVILLSMDTGDAFASAPDVVGVAEDKNLVTASVTFHVIPMGGGSSADFQMDSLSGSGGSGFYVLNLSRVDWMTYFAGLPEGFVAGFMSAEDDRGNYKASETVYFIVDRTDPSLTCIAPINGTACASAPTFIVDVADALSPVNVECSYDNGVFWELVAQELPKSGSRVDWVMNETAFSNLDEGVFTVYIGAYDDTGENYVMLNLSLVKDSRAPWIRIVGPSPANLLGKAPPVLNISVSDDSDFSLAFTLVCSGDQNLTMEVPAGAIYNIHGNTTDFSFQIPMASWATIQYEGDAVLYLAARDAQNLSSMVSKVVKVDTLPARVSIVYPLGGSRFDAPPFVRIIVTEVNFVSAYYTIDGGISIHGIGGSNLPGTAIFDISPVAWDAEAAYSKYVNLMVFVEDAGGNVGIAQVTLERADYLEYGPGPNPWIIFSIFDQAWPVQVLFWAPVGIFAVYAIVARRRKQSTAPQREVAL